METHSLTHLMSVSEVHVIACKSCDEAEQFDWTAIQMTGRMKIGTVCLYGERLELHPFDTASTAARASYQLSPTASPHLEAGWVHHSLVVRGSVHQQRLPETHLSAESQLLVRPVLYTHSPT
jgi:hypothetical protein